MLNRRSTTSTPSLLLVLVALCATLLASGCTVPGAGHIHNPPKGLPASVHYIPGDAIGWTLMDTDPASEQWRALARALGPERSGADNLALTALQAPLFEDARDVDLAATQAWVGESAGRVLRTFDLDGDYAGSSMYFADVKSREALEEFLREEGWREDADADLGSGDLANGLTLWTRDAREGEGALSPTRRLTAVGVADDALVGARTTAGLRELVASAQSASVSNRSAMSRYTIQAKNRTAMAIVFRTDIARLQVRRLVQDDPASLELARWATVSSVLLALRDGWVGLAPSAGTPTHEAVRVVGSANWMQGLAPELVPEPVGRDVLERLPAGTDLAVAVHDPGMLLADAVGSITVGATEFATTKDVPKDEAHVKLMPLLEDLDGDSAFGWTRDPGVLDARVQVEDAAQTADDVRAAFAVAKVPGTVAAEGDEVVATVPLGGAERVQRPAGTLGGEPAVGTAFDAAGKPPTAPIAWLWKAGSECTGPTAGWVVWDRGENFHFSFDVDLTSTPSCTAERAPLDRALTAFTSSRPSR